MKLKEYDATSSGVQIAAALLRDPVTAELTNLRGGEPRDLYGDTLTRVHAAYPALKSVERDHMKSAMIPRIYGGGDGTSHSALREAGIDPTDDKELTKAFCAEVARSLKSVVAIQQWFGKVCEVIAENGNRDVKVRLPNGLVYTVELACDTRYMDELALSMTLPLADDEDRWTDRTGKERDFILYRTTVKGLQIPTNKLLPGKAGRKVCAAMIQSLDATVLAMTQLGLTELFDEGERYFGKHDALLVPEDRKDDLIRIYRESMHALMTPDLLGICHEGMQQLNGLTLPKPPQQLGWNIDEMLTATHLIG